VFHDWPDAVCVQILRNIIPAMRKGSRIIIMDEVVLEVGQVPNSVLKLSNSLDLQMMSVSNAKERKQRDWEAMIKSADERLIVKAIRHPPGSMAALIEFVLES
jgi:6-hydroxytryprostatin B O-methyltransferase